MKEENLEEEEQVEMDLEGGHSLLKAYIEEIEEHLEGVLMLILDEGHFQKNGIHIM